MQDDERIWSFRCSFSKWNRSLVLCFQGKRCNTSASFSIVKKHKEIKCHHCQYRSSVMQLQEMNVGKVSPTLLWCFNLKCDHRRVAFSTVDASKASAASACKCCVSTKPCCCHVQQPSLQENVTWRGQYASSKWTTKKRTWRTMI